MYQNFGVSRGPLSTELFYWTSPDAEIYASGKNRQFCLVNFNSGTLSDQVIFHDSILSTGCQSTKSVNIGLINNHSPNFEVIYSKPEFYCLDNTATGYQWGYDEIITKIPTILPKEINQNYYLENPDFVRYAYWVVASYGSGANGCIQKSYFNTPNGIIPVTDDVFVDIYPNPATNELNIKISGNKFDDNLKAILMDMSGREIVNENLSEGKAILNISGFAPGIYMVVLSRNGYRITTKTIVKE